MKTLRYALLTFAALRLLASCNDERPANPLPASSSYGPGGIQLYTADSSGSMSGIGNQ